MKNYYIVLLALLYFSCKKDAAEPFVLENYLERFQKEKIQVFELGLTDFEEIKGGNGTKVMFNREAFEVDETANISLELIELYEFNEILYRNIQTLTINNELLETSGVLKLRFTANGKELKLKPNEKILIYPPKGKLKDNDIFIAKTDSIGQIKWNKTNQEYVHFSIHLGGGIYKESIILRDSLESYKKRELKIKNTLKQLNSIDNDIFERKNNEFFILNDDSWPWINLDKIVLRDAEIDFKLLDNKDEFEGFTIYTKYEFLNSFLSEVRLKEDLIFDKWPLRDKTTMLVVGKKKGELFFDEIVLSKSMQDKTISLKMKKTNAENLKARLTKK